MARTSPSKSQSTDRMTPTASARNTLAPGPTHEQISRRAYEIFLARGGTHGRHEEDWYQAERELRLGKQ